MTPRPWWRRWPAIAAAVYLLWCAGVVAAVVLADEEEPEPVDAAPVVIGTGDPLEAVVQIDATVEVRVPGQAVAEEVDQRSTGVVVDQDGTVLTVAYGVVGASEV